MPQTISPDLIRICRLCGSEFHPKARKQYCCNEMRPRTCECCGKEFLSLCSTANTVATCSKECQVVLIKKKREASAASAVKICKWCGKEFHPTSVRQVYCNETHYQTCVVCRKQFEIDPRKADSVKTCSKECRYKLMNESTDREAAIATQKAHFLEKYGVENAMQIPGVVDKIKQTNVEKYGAEWYTQTDEYKQRAAETDMQKYGVAHHLQSQEVIDKRKQTCLDKYGAENVFSSEEGKRRVKEQMFKKYGVTNPSQYAEFKAKATKNARTSKLEIRICNLLDNYGIQYIHHYFLKSVNCSHEFDFYIPEYKLLIDADGLYFHSYLDDPDGVRVRDDYDETRLQLIPEDHTFHVIVEGQEDRQIKEIVELIEQSSGSLSTYDSVLFDWCRSIEFPYPEYLPERMLSDWKHLQSYQNDAYVPQCRFGESIIKHFHKSIYDCRVGESVSPVEGWNDDNLLRQVIRNRFIYKNDVDPSKILSGFNISKICPRVSIFNPVLARYLISKYLNQYDTIFDPFSGFSGRLLGAASLGKKYIGQDIRQTAVDESNSIIDFLQLDNVNYKISKKDILESSGEYECLLTCPPYLIKEFYRNETTFKTCDGWIDECLARFKCSKYVFVVDRTDKYSEHIVEELRVSSDLNKVTEYVVVINR